MDDNHITDDSHILVFDDENLPDTITVYRTAYGHRVQAGCQDFTLDADIENLALDHGWTLPSNWRDMLAEARRVVATWH